jgi:hypothetical protein
MAEIKLSSNKSMAQRIADRQQNSGAGANPSITTKTGDSPNRVFHNIHNSPNLGSPNRDSVGRGGPLDSKGDR